MRAILIAVILLMPSLAFGQDEMELDVPAWDVTEQDNWTFQTYGSTSLWADSGEVNLMHVGVGYFFLEDISINAEFLMGNFDGNSQGGEPGNDGAVRGFDLIARWHFFNEEKWGLFVEGGASFLIFDDNFPANGTHSNFALQAGLGGLFEICRNVYFMGGARWHHISNAGRTENNPGFDGVMIYGCLLFEF